MRLSSERSPRANRSYHDVHQPKSMPCSASGRIRRRPHETAHRVDQNENEEEAREATKRLEGNFFSNFPISYI